MKRIALDGIWQLTGAGKTTECKIPGSVYSAFLEAGFMDDPHYRDNELAALALMDHEFTFSRRFSFEGGHPVLLRCEGLDTLCDIYLNDRFVAHTENMHRTFEFDVTDVLKKGENEIKLVFHPVDSYMKERQGKKPLQGAAECMSGFSYLRKAHCMMGWDWGPRLPDAGIWRSIYLLEKDSARITDFHIIQRHEAGRVFVTPYVTVDEEATVKVTVSAPHGDTFEIPVNTETEIENPALWWPNGLGDQPLYTLSAEITDNGKVLDRQCKRIGLRDMKLIREKDKWGEGFCHEVNGIRFFAMGADYIPEDNILSRITESRTRELLTACKDCNFNAIRVWGGGYYPDDFFFDICDELGIVVFLDMMFACCEIPAEEAFYDNALAEIWDNLKRIRHHSCIGIISGNNEIEQLYWGEPNPDRNDNYIRFFEDCIPEIVKAVCPYIPYISSSPTTCGHMLEPNNEDYGDGHYWSVWHGRKPFTEYRKKFFRYLSEFGFQSFPCEKTINAITAPEDRNIFSRVMEMHQRNGSANGKILSYLSETYLYPTNFGTLLYTSQLLQAEAIKYGVEHFRRNRGRCMGTLYWQLNDIWPVASWASIDYYGRYKALQYYAKRFYAPVLLSCMETGERDTRPDVNMERIYGYETKAKLVLTNDTKDTVTGMVTWELINQQNEITAAGKEAVTLQPFSVTALDELDFAGVDVNTCHLSFRLEIGGEIASQGCVLFTAPKYFQFNNPNLRYEMHGDEITVFADGFAKSVEIDSPDSDFVLSDNFFDMEKGQRTVKILKGEPKTISLRSVYDIR